MPTPVPMSTLSWTRNAIWHHLVSFALVDAARAVATKWGTGLVDVTNLWGLYTAANAAGDMSDTRHPSNQGYTKIAGYVYTEALRMAGV